MLGNRPERRAPAVAAHSRGVVDRQPLVLADLRAAASFRAVLVLPCGPSAFEIDLRGGRRNARDDP